MTDYTAFPKVLDDKVLIRFQKKDKTESGIYLPERQDKAEDEVGEVLSVGTDPNLSVVPGDLIYFNPAAAMIVTLEGDKYILITQKGIIAIKNYYREGRNID